MFPLETTMISASARIKTAEGVGFEPTVGYPTLDFESSALNRTQPPFPFSQSAGVPALIINCAGVIVNFGLAQTAARRGRNRLQIRYDRW